MGPDENQSVMAPSPTHPHEHIISRVPAGWVPSDVVIRVWARHNAGYGWEALIPEFSIAGMGDTLDSSLENAIELLDDYLFLCARDGADFSAARRPLPTRETARLVGEFVVGRIVGKLGSGHSNRKKLDLPFHVVAS